MFTKVVKCKPDMMPLSVFWLILWKEAVRQRYEIAYIAIKEGVTFIIAKLH